jgi:hypothetical protein
MTEEQKASIYGNLLTEHTRLFNEINHIKSQNLDLNQQQIQKIKQMEARQAQIMNQIRQLFS